MTHQPRNLCDNILQLIRLQTMRPSIIFVCLLLHLKNISCRDSKYYSTFGDLVLHFGESGSGIHDYVTLKNDIKSRFSEERF